MKQLHLRVDLAGTWLASHPTEGGFLVNCTIDTSVDRDSISKVKYSGLGGFSADRILHGDDEACSKSVLGWQDSAILDETGLCCWVSGKVARLHFKRTPSLLAGKMALLWTEEREKDPDEIAAMKRDYDVIQAAGLEALQGIMSDDFDDLSLAVQYQYGSQMDEGMKPLVDFTDDGKCTAKKYCGIGWGGYALYLFNHVDDRHDFVEANEDATIIEPWMRYL